MKAMHGSKNKIEEFKLFNYKIERSNNEIDNENVSGGLDAYGPGVYFFNNSDDEGMFASAKNYTDTENTSYIYEVDLDIEEDDLLNTYENDYFMTEDLVRMVETYIEEERKERGYDWEEINEIIYEAQDDFENLSKSNGDVALLLINKKLENKGIRFRLDEWQNPKEFSDFDSWVEQITEKFEMDEPCSHITNEGGPEALVNYCVDSAENAWEVINNIFLGIAVYNEGSLTYSNNKKYQDLVLRELEEYNVLAAQVDDHIIVAFDTDIITIKEVTELSPRKKRERKLNSSI